MSLKLENKQSMVMGVTSSMAVVGLISRSVSNQHSILYFITLLFLFFVMARLNYSIAYRIIILKKIDNLEEDNYEHKA